jgi:hypothetical protein
VKKCAAKRRWQYALQALGVLMATIGVCLMAEGSVLGERTTGIASLISIVACSTIAMSANTGMLRRSRKSSK